MRTTPISMLPAKPRVRRTRRKAPTSSTPVAPVLVAATFDTDDGAHLTLTFDRAVSVGAGSPDSIVVLSHPTTELFEPSGASQPDPTVVKFELLFIDSCDEGPDVVLNASAGNGIASADGGVAWAGASGLELPYP